MFRTKLTVRYAETDQMGVVHHSRYFPWFEVGRTEFMASAGLPYSEIEKMGVWFPLTDCSAKFIRGAKYGDEVFVEASLALLTPARARFGYSVLRAADGVLLATGETGHAFSTPQMKPMNLKKAHPEIYAMLEGLAGKCIVEGK